MKNSIRKFWRKIFFNSVDALQKSLDKYLVFTTSKELIFRIIKTGAIQVEALQSKHSFLLQRFLRIVNLDL